MNGATLQKLHCSSTESSWSEPAPWGSSGPGPSSRTSTTPWCSGPHWRTSRGPWSTSAAAAGCRAWCSRWLGPTSTSSSWTPAPSAAASSRRPRRRWASRAEVIEGRAEVDRAHGAPGSRRRGGGPQLRRCRRPPPSAAVPCSRVGGRLVVSEPPPPPQPDRWPAAGLRRLGLEATRAGGRRHLRPGARAANPVPGRLSPPRRRARPSSRSSERAACSTWNIAHAAAWTQGREFHVEHRERSLHRAVPPGRMQR